METARSRKRILFVDDEPAVLDGLRRMLHLREADWELGFAQSAQEALDWLGERKVDAVVSDVRMPGKDGFELLREMREWERVKDVPVIILTGTKERNLKSRALDLGATDLLNKPVEPEDLVARLRSVLRLKSYQDALRAQNERLEHRVEERTAELADSRREIIWRLAKAAEFRDEETGNHVVRVGCYCRVIASAIGQDASFVELIFLTSPLHDIGKIGIPDRILLKPGALTASEWQAMQQHCVIGAEILRQDAKLMTLFRDWEHERRYDPHQTPTNPILEMAGSIALTHHEKWNGTGYPAGLSGDRIPVESRIVALADVYDALCSERPYKPRLAEEEALAIIRGEVGRHFDPEVYRAFERSLPEIRSIRDDVSDTAGRPVSEVGAR